jgi:DnaJ-class molecular chaperone
MDDLFDNPDMSCDECDGDAAWDGKPCDGCDGTGIRAERIDHGPGLGSYTRNASPTVGGEME